MPSSASPLAMASPDPINTTCTTAGNDSSSDDDQPILTTSLAPRRDNVTTIYTTPLQPSSTTSNSTLYARLGGDEMMSIVVWSFFDELVDNPEMAPFFHNVAMVAMKTHTVKLFRIMFGTLDEQPDDGDLREYLLRTHTRLFRDLKLNERHFDTLAECFVHGLQSFLIPQDVIDDCVAVLSPLRNVFAYGAQLAAQEKLYTKEERQKLPSATAATIGTTQKVVLPSISCIAIPAWLPPTLKSANSNNKKTKKMEREGDDDQDNDSDGDDEEIVRRWTCNLTDRFGAEGDSEIADTYLDQPYMDHHIYNVAFLQLTFWPSMTTASKRQHDRMLDIVKYPRGRAAAPLSQYLWDRMIAQFVLACQDLKLSKDATDQARIQLESYKSHFATETVRVGGSTCLHILSKQYQQGLRGKGDGRRSTSENAVASSSTSSISSAELHQLLHQREDSSSTGDGDIGSKVLSSSVPLPPKSKNRMRNFSLSNSIRNLTSSGNTTRRRNKDKFTKLDMSFSSLRSSSSRTKNSAGKSLATNISPLAGRQQKPPTANISCGTAISLMAENNSVTSETSLPSAAPTSTLPSSAFLSPSSNKKKQPQEQHQSSPKREPSDDGNNKKKSGLLVRIFSTAANRAP